MQLRVGLLQRHLESKGLHLMWEMFDPSVQSHCPLSLRNEDESRDSLIQRAKRAKNGGEN